MQDISLSTILQRFSNPFPNFNFILDSLQQTRIISGVLKAVILTAGESRKADTNYETHRCSTQASLNGMNSSEIVFIQAITFSGSTYIALEYVQEPEMLKKLYSPQWRHR